MKAPTAVQTVCQTAGQLVKPQTVSNAVLIEENTERLSMISKASAKLRPAPIQGEIK